MPWMLTGFEADVDSFEAHARLGLDAAETDL